MDFLNGILDNISSEFSRDKETVRKLDVKYREFQKNLIGYEIEKNNYPFRRYNGMIREVAGKIEGWQVTDQYNLLINIVHMHVNRIFENKPREYEYVIYHFMKKHQAYLNYTSNGMF